MPDVAPAAAPAGATATGQQQSTRPPVNGNGTHSPRSDKPGSTSKSGSAEPSTTSATKAPAKAETSSTDEWGEEQEKTFVDLLRRKSKADPRFRTRVKGEERGIESPDDLASLFTDAQRGRAATKTVEETKAKAAKLAEREKAVEDARAAFESGDLGAIERAMRALAGDKAPAVVRALADREGERARLLEQLSPTERELLQRQQSLEAELAQHREEKQRAMEAEKQAEETKRVDSVRREAAERATHILTTLKLPAEKLDVLGPHLITAMREATEVGLEAGRDVPPEQLLEYATQRATEVSVGFFTGLTPSQQYDALGEKVLAGLVREHLKRGKLKASTTEEAPRQQRREAPKSVASLGSASYFTDRKR